MQAKERTEVILVSTPVFPVPVHTKAHIRHYHAHNHGCRTESCDDRVDAWLRRWYAEHAPPPERPSEGPQNNSEGQGAPGNLPECTWRPESGGDWSAVNPESGAGGYYQITPETWAAYGGQGAPQDASPAEQTRIAQRIYANQGPHAWVNC